jgi:SAM-dependent methyltransferase
MTAIANPSVFETWNGDSGQRWSPAPTNATASGATNVDFVRTDTQTQHFEPASIDLVISRFGTMIFADPEAAFTNTATALRPGGRLCFATWQPIAANEWLIEPGAALLNHADLPAGAADEPRMSTQSEPDRFAATLDAAGFTDIGRDATNVTFTLGQTLDEAVDYLADSGPGRALLETITGGAARDAAVSDVRAILAAANLTQVSSWAAPSARPPRRAATPPAAGQGPRVERPATPRCRWR